MYIYTYILSVRDTKLGLDIALEFLGEFEVRAPLPVVRLNPVQ